MGKTTASRGDAEECEAVDVSACVVKRKNPLTSAVSGFDKRGRRVSNPQPPDRQSYYQYIPPTRPHWASAGILDDFGPVPVWTRNDPSGRVECLWSVGGVSSRALTFGDGLGCRQVRTAEAPSDAPGEATDRLRASGRLSGRPGTGKPSDDAWERFRFRRQAPGVSSSDLCQPPGVRLPNRYRLSPPRIHPGNASSPVGPDAGCRRLPDRQTPLSIDSFHPFRHPFVGSGARKKAAK